MDFRLNILAGLFEIIRNTILISVDLAVDLDRTGSIFHTAAPIYSAGNTFQEFPIFCLEHHVSSQAVDSFFFPGSGRARVYPQGI